VKKYELGIRISRAINELTRATVVDHADHSKHRAAVIFSRYHLENPAQLLIGSGRMQMEICRSLLSLGYDVTFAGQEDWWFSNEVLTSELFVTTVPALLKLPSDIEATKLLYTCNTHVSERNARLLKSAQKWGLEVEELFPEQLYRQAYETADYLLIAENASGISNFTSRGISPDKIRTYHNCVDTDIWIPSGKKRDKMCFICWASSLGIRKGLPSMLNAWRAWYHDQDAEFHIVAMPSTSSDVLLKGLRRGQAGPGLYVHFDSYPGQFQPLIDFIGSCHVGVYPTLEDAMPSSLLEMASCGLPIITTVQSGVEFTSDFCYYTEPDDPESLVQAFEFWYSSRAEIPERGSISREYILKNHSWNHFRKRFPEIISEVCGLKQTSQL